MTALDPRLDDWLDLVLQLVHGPVTDQMPRPEILQALSGTFEGHSSWNEVHSDGTLVFEVPDLPTNWPGHSEYEWWHHHGPEVHPLIQWYAVTGSTAAMTMNRIPTSLFASDGRIAIRERLGPIGIDQQMSIPVWMGRGESWAFVMAKTGEDFSREDLNLARAIQPLLALVARQARVAVPATDDGFDLTGRERAVLVLLCESWTAEAIARRLGISPRTVHQHLGNIYRKLGVHDRLSAYRVALRHGFTKQSPRNIDS
jgi:DNA-binding CsgD family transcriptional regulator